jgi:hypothetical protein
MKGKKKGDLQLCLYLIKEGSIAGKTRSAKLQTVAPLPPAAAVIYRKKLAQQTSTLRARLLLLLNSLLLASCLFSASGRSSRNHEG